MKTAYLIAIMFVALPAVAQLPAPNAAGVSAGHHIFVVKDLEAANKFWTALGGEPAQLGNVRLLKFPGVLFLARQGSNAGGTEGSTVEYLGFKVRDLKGSLAKWQASGIKPLLPGATPTEVFLMGPDGIKYRIVEDKTLTTAIAADTLKMNVPDPAAARAWYAKWFGGPDIPGAPIQFAQAKGAAGTKGRALDRLGFEVTNLEEFVKKLQASGAKFDGPIRKASGMALSVAVLTDPWGTYIELSQGFAAVK